MCPKLGGNLFVGEVLIVGHNVQDDTAGSGKRHPRVVARQGQVSVSQPITAIAVRVRGWGDPLLHAYGFDVVARPESFLVTKQDLLDLQETTRARLGTKLAAGIAPSRALWRSGRSGGRTSCGGAVSRMLLPREHDRRAPLR
jgi:hypothetical protein